jgi:heme-degrading monooxygenase HmoA
MELLEVNSGSSPQKPPQVVRIVRSDFDTSRSDEYERFENFSLHMWIRQRGYQGTEFLRSGPNGSVTITWWEDRKSVEALLESPTYLASMKKLEDLGMLVGPQTIELLEIKHGFTARQPAASSLPKVSTVPYMLQPDDKPATFSYP